MINSEEKPPPIDIAVLSTLVGDDAERQRRLLKKFIDSAMAIASMISAAVEAEDLAEVIAQAHKFKSSSKSVGASALTELSESIEKAGQSNRMEAVKTLALKIEGESATVCHYITDLISKD